VLFSNEGLANVGVCGGSRLVVVLVKVVGEVTGSFVDGGRA
jgi:hypothetical protein